MNSPRLAVVLAASFLLLGVEVVDAEILCDASTTTGRSGVATADSGETPHDLAHDEQEMFSVLREAELTTGLVLSALLLAFALGALHSLSPGHGKALVAAYLVGSRGTIGHAIALGGIVTFSHVFSVILLGIIALVAADYLVPEKLSPVLGAISGLLIFAVGILMFRRAINSRARSHHPYDDAGDHFHDHDRQHSDLSVHDHPHLSPRGDVRLGSLVALGVSGGMVPCPSAMVVLLTAIALGRIGLGLALVLAFSLGLAAVLMTISVVLVTMQGFLERVGGGSFVTRAGRVLPLVSATVVTAVGLLISWRSFVDVGKVFL